MVSGPKNIVVTGSSGQLGMEFQLLTLLYPDFQFHFYSKSEWDIEDGLKAEEVFQNLAPYCLINCAAYTQVEKAEDEPELAYRINGDACETLALACNKHNVLLVHISTDYVFDGSQKTPYSETSATHPLNVYGKSKRMGEEKIELHAERFIILRTSWLYSTFGNNFFKTMLRLSAEKEELRVVSDQFSSPTYARFLAHDLLTWLEKISSEEISFQSGIYHYAQTGETSWCGFAREIMANAGLSIPVHAVRSSDFPTKAIRPSYSTLQTTKFTSASGIDIPSWREGVVSCLSHLLEKEDHHGDPN